MHAAPRQQDEEQSTSIECTQHLDNKTRSLALALARPAKPIRCRNPATPTLPPCTPQACTTHKKHAGPNTRDCTRNPTTQIRARNTRTQRGAKHINDARTTKHESCVWLCWCKRNSEAQIVTRHGTKLQHRSAQNCTRSTTTEN